MQENIKEFQQTLAKAEKERDEEPVDLDKIIEEPDIISKKT
jgi:uncharacterized membrane protein (DUF106 family)